MHRDHIGLWQHHHSFNSEKKSEEKRTLIVVIVTLVTMVLEIFFGWISHSMALLADGWHMGTHALALGVSLSAYIIARKLSMDHRFTFGTWKIEILGAYTSAIVLGMVGIMMIFTSIERMIHPMPILYNQALLVAIIGLSVNLACAVILHHPHSHHDHHDHESPDSHHSSHHTHHGDDLNFKSAYIHVVTDALTSVLAILALVGAKFFAIQWLDPFMGIVGGGLILHWTISLLKDTSGILLEYETDTSFVDQIRTNIESDGDSTISDLHVWKIAQDKYACIISVVARERYPAEEYKQRLKTIHELVHITIEMNPCKEEFHIQNH